VKSTALNMKTEFTVGKFYAYYHPRLQGDRPTMFVFKLTDGLGPASDKRHKHTYKCTPIWWANNNHRVDEFEVGSAVHDHSDEISLEEAARIKLTNKPD
jgi:hypothetical protein